MPKLYGNVAAAYVVDARVHVPLTDWVPLRVGSSNLADRAWIEVQTMGKVGNVVYFSFINTGESVPAAGDSVKGHPAIRGTASRVFPLSDKVTLYAKMDNKAGTTENGVDVVVTEYR